MKVSAWRNSEAGFMGFSQPSVKEALTSQRSTHIRFQYSQGQYSKYQARYGFLVLRSGKRRRRATTAHCKQIQQHRRARVSKRTHWRRDSHRADSSSFH